MAGMFTRILCPLDLSDFSTHALEHAVVIARWYSASVTAVHVFATWVPPGSLTSYPGWMLQISEARKQIEDELREMMQPAKAAGMDVPLVIREGNPVAAILEEAGRVEADLIVMSTHGRSGFDRLTLGSVTEKILRKASTPVLTVPASPGPSRGFAGYRRILCATDFSDYSRKALDYAVSLARQAGVGLTLFHVVEGADADAGVGLEPGRREDAERNARQAMQALLEDLDAGIAIEQAVAFGTPHREILARAEQSDTDLIVIGVRGRGSVDLTLFGSTTNQVVRRASCAVLTIRTG